LYILKATIPTHCPPTPRSEVEFGGCILQPVTAVVVALVCKLSSFSRVGSTRYSNELEITKVSILSVGGLKGQSEA
jgi:hypothetical protein